MDPESMACAIFGFVLLAFLLGFVFFVATMISRTSRLNQGFRIASNTLRGQFSPGGVWKNPAVSLRYGNTAGRLRIDKSASVECTEFSLNWPVMDTKFEMISRNHNFKYRRSDWEELELDNQRLNQVLRARALDVNQFKRYLSEGVYWQLEKLASYLPQRDLYCGCLRRQLIIRKWGVIKNSDELVQLVRLGMELYDQFQLTQVVGIDFVESMEATLLEDIDCPICGDAIERNLVTCTSCKTPHHRECWDYNGRCATFACGQETYSRPAVARPIVTETTSEEDESDAAESSTEATDRDSQADDLADSSGAKKADASIPSSESAQ